MPPRIASTRPRKRGTRRGLPVGAPAVRERHQRVVPDGCVDLIWLAERELVIAGPDTGPRSVHPARERPHLGDTAAAGRRRRCPGRAGLRAARHRGPGCADLGRGGRGAGSGPGGGHPRPRLDLLTGAIAAATPSPMRIAVAAATGSPSLARASHGRRRTRGQRAPAPPADADRRRLRAEAVRPLARLRRLVELPATIRSRRAGARRRYANQTHMSDEVRRLTGTTPVRFLEDAQPTAA